MVALRYKYTENPHTDQYLLWKSEHTAHKLSVGRTLYDRTKVHDNHDREEEENHIRQALKACNYPNWVINKRQERGPEEQQGGEKEDRFNA